MCSFAFKASLLAYKSTSERKRLIRERPEAELRTDPDEILHFSERANPTVHLTLLINYGSTSHHHPTPSTVVPPHPALNLTKPATSARSDPYLDKTSTYVERTSSLH